MFFNCRFGDIQFRGNFAIAFSLFDKKRQFRFPVCQAEITVSRCMGRMQRAKASTVVPDAIIMESSLVISEAAIWPMCSFSLRASFSFSFTERLLM